jgi:hypothetical protein
MTNLFDKCTENLGQEIYAPFKSSNEMSEYADELGKALMKELAILLMKKFDNVEFDTKLCMLSCTNLQNFIATDALASVIHVLLRSNSNDFKQKFIEYLTKKLLGKK